MDNISKRKGSAFVAGAPSASTDAGATRALTETRALRRAALRRMPTEMIQTTRMQPVLPPSKPASGVRPLPDNPEDFDRRMTVPYAHDHEIAVVDAREFEDATGYAREIALGAAASPDRRAPRQLDRHAQHDTMIADYAAMPPPSHMVEGFARPIGELPARHSRTPAPGPMPPPPRHSRTPTPSPVPPPPRRSRTPTPSPVPPPTWHRRGATPVPQAAADHEPARQHVAPSFHRAFNDHSQASAPSHAADGGGRRSSVESIKHMREQLEVAVDRLRRSEQRALQAEQRASWAERFAAHLQAPELEFRAARRRRRMALLKRMLQLAVVGLALGGYVWLLMPLRERVTEQNAVIQKLVSAQRELRSERQQLLDRIEGTRGSSQRPVVEKSAH